MSLASPVDRAEAPLFTDGLGERVIAADATTGELLQILRLRPELTAVPSFEFALRERTARLVNFRHAYYARVRRIDRVQSNGSLAVVSDHVEGTRLSEILRTAQARRLQLDTNAALCLIRQLVPAVALLHENARDASHGSISPERIVVTPHARLVIVEHVLGSAIEQLQFSRERLWQEFRVAMPASAGISRFDHRADVNGIGVTALSLVLGRPLAAAEFPHAIPSLLMQARERSSYGEERPLSNAFRNWLARTLQLDVRRAFASAPEALASLEETLASDTAYVPAPVALETFLSQYMAAMLDTNPIAPPLTVATPAAIVSTAAVVSPAAPVRAFDPSAWAIDEPVAVRPVEAMAPRRVEDVPLDRPRTPVRPDTPAPAFALTVSKPQEEPATSEAESRESAWRALEELPTLADLIAVKDLREAAGGHPASEPHIENRVPSPEPVRVPEPVPDPEPLTDPEPLDRTEHAVVTCEAVSTPADARTAAKAEEPDVEVRHTGLAPSRRRPRKRLLMTAVAAALIIAAAGVFGAWSYSDGDAVAATPDLGTLIVQSSPAGVEVFVDGVSRGMTPLRVSLDPGSHILELRGRGVPRVIPFQLAAGGQVSQYLEFAEAPETGLLVVHSQPPGAKVIVDGVARGEAPITLEGMAPGDHEVILQNADGSSKHTVKVLAGTTASLVAPVVVAAAEGPVSGWVSVKAPVTIEIREGGKLIGTTDSDRVMMAAGRHSLEFVNETLGFREARAVQITPGKVTALALQLPKGTVNLNAIPWADVWIDGRRVGETPIGNLEVPLGPHEIVFRHPELGEKRHAVSVTAGVPVRLSVSMK